MLYRLYVSMQRLAGMIPRRMRWRIGGFIAQAVYWLWPAKRQATLQNMSVVLGLPVRHPRVQRTARLSWRNYGRFSGDLFDLPNHPPAFYINAITDLTGPPLPDGTMRALQLVDEARALGKGVVITTGHYGHWDVAGMLVASRAPLYVIAEALPDERLNRLLQEQRQGMGMSVLMIEDALRPMMRLLRAGDMIATPVDRPVPPNEGIPVTFFGKTAYVPRGLGALAARLGAAIVAGFVWGDRDGGYRVFVNPPVVITPSGDPDADAIRATQVMFDALERMIRQDPTQWYMFRPFWPHAQDAAPAPTPVATEAAAHE